MVPAQIKKQAFLLSKFVCKVIYFVLQQIELRHFPDEQVVAYLNVTMAVQTALIFRLSNEVPDVAAAAATSKIDHPLALLDFCHGVQLLLLSVGLDYYQTHARLRAQ